MAGTYADAPSRRIGYDDDGTVALYYAVDDGIPAFGLEVPFYPGDGVAYPVHYQNPPQADLDNLNDEDSATFVFLETTADDQAVYALVLVFPEKHDIAGYFWQATSTDAFDNEWLFYSLNAQHEQNGTWTALGSQVRTNSTTFDDYRDTITSDAISGVSAVAMTMQASGTIGSEDYWLRAFHLYGLISAAETPDRLIFIDTDFDSKFTKVQDYGDIADNQTSQRTIKVQNISGGRTATGTLLDVTSLTDASDTWYTMSLNDVDFSTTLSLGNMGAGQTKTVYLRQKVPDPTTTGLYAARIEASTTSWT